MPFSMFEASSKAACPPDLTAKGHCVNLESRTATETEVAVGAFKMQRGSLSACCDDQKALVKLAYRESSGVIKSFP